MAELKVSAQAERDLKSIYEYSVERFGIDIAETYILGFDKAFDRLRRFPQVGAVHIKVTPAIRSFVHKSHRIFYDFDGGVVTITRILHRAQDIGSLSKQ